MSTPIAIVGTACLFPKADGLTRYWGNIKRGVDAIGPVPESHWSPDDYFDPNPKRADHTYAQQGGFLEPVPFDPTAYGIAPHALEATDSAQVLGLMVAAEALKHAGYGPERSFDRSRVSVVLGVTGTLQLVIPLGARLGHPHWRRALKAAGVPVAQAEQVMQHLQDAYVPWQEASFPGLLGNVVAGRIANRLDLGGTNCVVDAACASSLSAVHLACLELASGRASMVVTGGVDAFNDIFMYMCFSKTPALSPSGQARPYDAQGDGTILGEGVGMLVLKRLVDAERDGDEILAVIRGVGTASDGRGKAIYAPDDDGQQRALQSAYAAAGVTPDTIELLEGHGTGTKVGDAIEVKALRRVFGDVAPGQPRCALGSVKSQIGHTKAAAGAAGLIKATLALYHKVLPPTCKVKQPLPILEEPGSPFYLPDSPRPWLRRAAHPRRAGVSSFGFGGSNFHAVLEEYTPERVRPDWGGDLEIVTLAAQTGVALLEQLKPFETCETWLDVRLAAAQSRRASAHPARCRLAFLVEENVTDLPALLERLRRHVTAEVPFEWPDGVFYSIGDSLGRLGVLFPGQGAQYLGMARDWLNTFPASLNALQTMEHTLALYGGGELPFGQRLVDRIYPPTNYRPDSRARHEDELRATQVAQPAIGAISLGMWTQLQSWGLRPVAAAGHSYGELTALMAAGRISVADFARLSVLRGRLMASTGVDRGAMLAVVAPVNEIEGWLSSQSLNVVVANRNAPMQVVLSGTTPAIEQAESALKSLGKRVVRLPVSAAFHSPLVADAERPLAEALGSVTVHPGQFPVFSNTVGAAYPAEQDAVRQMLAHQLAAPVNWVAQIEGMYAMGVKTFLEVGPGARLSGLVKSILGDRPHAAFSLDASNGKRGGVSDLARGLAQLWSLGHALDLSLWQGGEGVLAPLKQKKKPKMVVMVSGAPYRNPRPEGRSLEGKHDSSTATAPGTLPNPHGGGTDSVNNQPPDISPVPLSDNGVALQAAIQASLETVAAWQANQQKAAEIHRDFLLSQKEAQENLRQMMEQQRRLLMELSGQALTEFSAAPVESRQAPERPTAEATPRAAVAAVRQKLRKLKGAGGRSAPPQNEASSWHPAVNSSQAPQTPVVTTPLPKPAHPPVTPASAAPLPMLPAIPERLVSAGPVPAVSPASQAGIAVPAPVSQPVTPVVPLVAPAPMPAVSAPVVSSPGVDTASV
ncbi:MAG: beta-ketoacyl synthase N-terminal-like domain-containing protein, partial [Candidatus Sericytochromatia bacterium]|nr:beta-ketoacyl synthase N-terminal-like domain-containing protein [Candidatus Sericytochromatia bacterium]